MLNERLSLELAPNSETSLLGFDEEGAALGYLGLDTVLPVWGTVRPARPGKRDKLKNPTSEVSKTEGSWIQDRIDEIYVAWVVELAAREFTEKDKDRAFQLLSLTKGELGSSSKHQRALLAQKLWGLPLFRLVDGTRVSGESLAARLSSEGGPLLISSERWRVPGHTPLIKPESREHSLLRAVLGKECLHWYEAPPLVDTERLKSKVSKLVAWGFSPLTAMQRKLEAVAESWETALQKKRVSEQKPVPKRQADASPEERLLSLMQMEARTLLGTQTHRNAYKFFSQTRFGSWILGPPIYWADDICCFNRLHPTLRWLVQLDPKNSDKHCRAARVLLLIHWVDLINVKSPEFSDEQEREFLQKLSERMIQSFS